ncbi:PadR family transcriptional regulator [Paenibacillus sp. MZ04-78.2]|uniref:PadR family transcriptional regulator n=1 Tax=Paenibacillus sp. MZ04-78.2 TaxID=2962034 RepID=UPI0020B68D2D|nr:PadR family transcriptional regulator [Paenibacillus sp. MZ04-78.2]MCP3772662.1 PadR family transcriptional regulator [Paenibacillus sp. MZ04-78.2]
MSSTRLLILGVLLKRQPIHGYDVRKELEIWHAGKWANIAYGSIYFALNKMASEGLAETASSEKIIENKKGPARIAYLLTDKGRQEFERLLDKAIWEYKPGFDSFHIALMFMNHIPKDHLLRAFHHRINLLRAEVEGFKVTADFNLFPANSPHYLSENLRLFSARLEAELRWIEGMVGKLEQGLLF